MNEPQPEPAAKLPSPVVRDPLPTAAVPGSRTPRTEALVAPYRASQHTTIGVALCSLGIFTAGALLQAGWAAALAILCLSAMGTIVACFQLSRR